MYFVYLTRQEPHGNGKAPDWCLIDFKCRGLRNGWQLGDKYNDTVWGEDLYKEIKANPEKFLIVEAKDYNYLQITKEYREKWNEYVMSAVKPESNLGWIAPSGQFIGCSYYDHAFIAENYLHSSEERLEEEGWCKVYALGEKEAKRNEINYYTKNHHFTLAQEETKNYLDAKFPYVKVGGSY